MLKLICEKKDKVIVSHECSFLFPPTVCPFYQGCDMRHVVRAKEAQDAQAKLDTKVRTIH